MPDTASLEPGILALLCVPCCIFAGLYSWLGVRWITAKNNPKNVHIYGSIGFYYPLKYRLFRFLLWLRRRQNMKRLEMKEASSTGAGYGMKSRNSPEEMDKVQVLADGFPMAVDAVYFNGVSQDGAFVVAATARRPENYVNTVLFIKLPNIGLLEMPAMPDTWMQDEKSKSAFTSSGLLISPVKCMEAWSIAYDGPMRKAESGDTVHVSFNLIWKARTGIFDFDTDIHPHAMAAAIARETWTKDFFNTLKEVHQTHYEQFGEISGLVHVEGHPDQSVKVQGLRDHSYGNVRDWKTIHRYALNYAYLEDGSSVFIGTICIPSMLSRMDFGYVFHPDGKMDTAERSDFEFNDWGDDGEDPEHFEVNFVAGGKQYTVKCSRTDKVYFYMGKDWDAKIHERVCNYSVNGVKGWGISEWDYRNYAGKAVEMARLKENKEDE
ncbi:hypothetical protein EGW08_005534 [Elysia chlorotica]|uniref:DUF7064 domain-containing protein n=1 Tax=Elysia chlorotica TaxID=188477 RepID=A0A3S0ZV74_ELYCH|nr:hypothetical protein EGW08_005534 [Elysia chlorotica]